MKQQWHPNWNSLLTFKCFIEKVTIWGGVLVTSTQVLHRAGHYIGSLVASTRVLHREGHYMGGRLVILHLQSDEGEAQSSAQNEAGR